MKKIYKEEMSHRINRVISLDSVKCEIGFLCFSSGYYLATSYIFHLSLRFEQYLLNYEYNLNFTHCYFNHINLLYSELLLMTMLLII